jgi:mono/diheme cytochrome c family protein
MPGHKKLTRFVWLLPLVALLMVACGDPTATNVPPTAAPPTATAVPTTTAAATTTAAVAATTTAAAPAPTPPLPTLADPASEAGRLVFAKTCAGCHLGQGTLAGRAPVLATSAKAIDPDFVRKQVRSGGTRMPAFDATKVSDEQIESLILYLKAIHKN